MNNENRNEEVVKSPVIATILMVAITVVLAGVLYVWASSLADDSTGGGGLDKYQFDSRDAAGSMSSDAGDALVHIKMTQGDDLSWSVLRVSIVVDGGNSFTCAEAPDADAACTYSIDDDNSWRHPKRLPSVKAQQTCVTDLTVAVMLTSL